MIEVTLYQSADGKRFDTKAECEAHEKELAVHSTKRDYIEIGGKIAFTRRQLRMSDENHKLAVKAVKEAHASSLKGFERRYEIARAEFNRVSWRKVLIQQTAQLRALILARHRCGKILGYTKSINYVFKMTGEAIAI